MHGITTEEELYWIIYNLDKTIKISGFCPSGSQTSFPEKLEHPETFIDKAVFIARLEELEMDTEQYL